MVKEWLELEYGYSTTCPFHSEFPAPHEICGSWFPNASSDGFGKCPCQQYAISTVRRRAREMIRFNGVKGGKK
jgi:hypothetical protein